MKHQLSHAFKLIALGMTAMASDQAIAATIANGPYYATPSWDQTLPSSTRFVVLSNFGNNAVLDRETGLVWEKVPNTFQFRWFNASRYCVDLKLGGRMGWRLPTIHELMSLIDPTQSMPALPSGHPFTVVPGGVYWAATTFAPFPTDAYTVGLSAGGTGFDSKANEENAAWCVRGGQGVDPS